MYFLCVDGSRFQSLVTGQIIRTPERHDWEPTEDSHIRHVSVRLNDKIRVSISRKYRKVILSGIARDLPICMRKKIK
jgi:hypothetical protein